MTRKLNASTSFIFFTIMIMFVTFLCLGIKSQLTQESTQEVNTSEEITVIIDAGHGGEDGGAIGRGNIIEKNLNLSIATKIGALLESNGIKVIYSRTEDVLLYDRNVDYKNRKKALDLAARVKIANETPNALFVSIHMNSFPQSQYRGLQVYYSKNDARSKSIAYNIQSAVKKQLQPQNQRKAVEATSRIYLLDRIEKPAILIECGFLSNPDECLLLSTEIYQNQLSEIISKEIKNYVEKNS